MNDIYSLPLFGVVEVLGTVVVVDVLALADIVVDSAKVTDAVAKISYRLHVTKATFTSQFLHTIA